MNHNAGGKARIAVVGSLNMDLAVRASRFPAAGETIAGLDFHMIPGGKGANQAIAAARQGASVVMIGRVGNDPFGRQLLDGVQRDGVEMSHLLTDESAPTGVAVIAIEEDGENFIIIVAGANGRLSPQDIDAAASQIADADALLVQLEVPAATVSSAVALARKCGTRVILNAAPAQLLPPSLLQSVDYLIVNETEAALLTGLEANRPRSAIESLAAQYPSAVVAVTVGEQGTLLAESGSITVVPGFEVNAVDTTGAGDAFAGAFAVALAEGKPAPDAVRWANAAGALAASALGAQPSLPTRESVSRLLAQQATS